MARNKGVSGKTHTKQQLDDYANQHNPNNKAYKAKSGKSSGRHRSEVSSSGYFKRNVPS